MQLAVLFALSLFLTTFAFAYAGDSIESKALKIPPVVFKGKSLPCPVLDLHAALKTKQGKCMSQALQHMEINDRDPQGNTVLHKAVAMNNLPVVKFLIRHGADYNYRDYKGLTARQIAESENNRRLTDYFLELETETQRLFDAVEQNNIVAASSSLMRGAALGARDIRLDTLLHRAAQSNFPEMGKLLIQHGAQLEARNHLGETPLITAALRDQIDFMEMLVNAGANVNAIDERRRTALDLAGVQENPKVLKLLKAAKAREGVSASVEHDWSESGPEIGNRGAP